MNRSVREHRRRQLAHFHQVTQTLTARQLLADFGQSADALELERNLLRAYDSVAEFKKGAAMAIEIDELPDRIQAVMRRIADVFPQDLAIESWDGEWVHFCLRGLADHAAITTLEAKHTEVLPGAEFFDYQILCSWSSTNGNGLWLHYLPNADAPRDYRPGVWFY
jgi:hypothetical protein